MVKMRQAEVPRDFEVLEVGFKVSQRKPRYDDLKKMVGLGL